MGQPRRNQIALDVTPYYHLVSRCVRRQFLCGDDPLTGKDYSYRREWIRRRLGRLVDAFAVDLCAYAVMSNHYHLVVRIDESAARSWSPAEVLRRWLSVFKGPAWMHEIINADHSTAFHPGVHRMIEAYRSRLMSLSWFMRCLNEPIARRANREDGVTGHFWQGRYRCQALADEGAVLAAMAYVDLNPVRAGMADRPEAASECSALQRFSAARSRLGPESKNPAIMSFDNGDRDAVDDKLPGPELEYLQLLDWTGRFMSRPDSAVIAADLPPIVARLGLAASGVIEFVTGRRRYSQSMLGRPDHSAGLARQLGRHYVRGYRSAARLFTAADRGFNPTGG
ncbi:transposase [Spiribacter vilamensis]|uniref:Transposase IS200-like domain-containing protein n=1 Tax=Spiribacter vilamensis TaxID=531306 RepID=A0A4Q8D280_9GAMM|nr:transposase [Spiribacter vilamensis]RZU99397.1 hypothetical protein EV698_1686 [Spiribacter vilamensis]TVO61626.1 transposase [Spiribacter vilamensis]